MASVIDVWRAVDTEAWLLGGQLSHLGRPIRTVERTRAAAPHLPELLDGSLLVVDAGLVASAEALTVALAEAELSPVAIMLAGEARSADQPEPLDAPRPILASEQPPATLAERASAYLEDEPGWLARLSTELRLQCAEASLSNPATSAGLVAARTRRGVAVVADGELRALHPRPAGRALAARFAAMHARQLTAGGHGRTRHRQVEGMWLLERHVRPGASVWLFDDLPFAAVDEVAAESAAVTLRALMRRPPENAHVPGHAPARTAQPPESGDPLLRTMLAVARHNGRVAPAARELGVHRNTVLYRLRRAAAEHGLDPRRPGDALRLLAEDASRG
jgi:hypothetical protein